MARSGVLGFHPLVERWFLSTFSEPTEAQRKGWPEIQAGRSTLLLAPTGSGKTLAAFLVAIDRLAFPDPDAPAKTDRAVRVLYVSPLKALGVDVEKNLERPIAGISATAEASGVSVRRPVVAIRSGDTPPAARRALAKKPPDILITTPESLYLLLTSDARRILRSVETVIVDEIHSLVAGKRGAHLFLSLERLEAERDSGTPLQRIGLSATARPAEEVGRLLAGFELKGTTFSARPVRIVEAAMRRAIELRVELPIEPEPSDLSAKDRGKEEQGNAREVESIGPRSTWPGIHSRLCDLIRAHRTTLIFVNSRRLAERLAQAINQEAGQELALAHHGSLAKERREQVEERLKRGQIPAIVATSSLELGIDMGTIDLVVQIEAPPSVAAGLQRVGRSEHRAGGTSRGVIVPKFRGDLLACAAAAERMKAQEVEETFFPRNPLDVLAQQMVAMTAMETQNVDALFDRVRCAAPFSQLPKALYLSVLEMLSGRLFSDSLALLRPRIFWEQSSGQLSARHGARRLAVQSGGTIPDRGLYGVFLREDGQAKRRVGELDEEMVFEARPQEVFLLGASSWRIVEITHDQVLVVPAPGEPGKMPFWRGDRPGRPVAFGRAIGELVEGLMSVSTEQAMERLQKGAGLELAAGQKLLEYLFAQRAVTGAVPSDRTIVLERFRDEVGDWRICILSPFGARVHAPWAMAIRSMLFDAVGQAIDPLWSDDGIVFRLPDSDAAPVRDWFFPRPGQLRAAVLKALESSSIFAARFRENAGRALLLPRRAYGRRTPLWVQRRRAHDLLQLAVQTPSFPIILETYRECLEEVFDIPSLERILSDIEGEKIRVVVADSQAPSPFSASLLFGYVANYIYEGDQPLAERRAQALSVDLLELRSLLGEAELRELLSAEAITSEARQLARLLPEQKMGRPEQIHDLLLSLGPLSVEEIAERMVDPASVQSWLGLLEAERRVFSAAVGGQTRFIAVEDATRFRDGFRIGLPAWLPAGSPDPRPEAQKSAEKKAQKELLGRYLSTHVPFAAQEPADHFGLSVQAVLDVLHELSAEARVMEGEFLPKGRGREWCHPEVLARLKRRSLALLRAEVQPVEPAVYARFLLDWQGVGKKRAGLDALLTTIEQLQGVAISAAVLEDEIFPARLPGYQPADLDRLCAAGEVLIRGIEPLGARDGRIALYLTDSFASLSPEPSHPAGEVLEKVRHTLRQNGAMFFADLVGQVGAFPPDLLSALFAGFYAGELTNDTLAPLRALGSARVAGRADGRRATAGRPFTGRARVTEFRSRRTALPGSVGRWSLLPDLDDRPTDTERARALCAQLLSRYGVLVREAVAAEGISGGFSGIYPVLGAMEEAGHVRRGYFVRGPSAAQFSLPGAEERLRAQRTAAKATVILAASDPANPFGAIFPWPAGGPQRSAGSQVILEAGELLGWMGHADRSLITFVPSAEAGGELVHRTLAQALANLVHEGRQRSLLLVHIDGREAALSPLAPLLKEAGFSAGSRGFLLRKGQSRRP